MERRRGSIDRTSVERRNSLDKTSLESGEKVGFVADIPFPGDLPLPTHDLCAKGAHGGHRKSIDATSTSDVISHDKITRKADQIISLGAVEGAEKFQNMQASNVERPTHVSHQTSMKLDTDIEGDHPLDTIEEVSEKKGLVTRAVESVAAAAGTVAGIFTSAAPTDVRMQTEGHMEVVEGTPQEKGLVDTALEKVWNVLTGKEELFPEATPVASDEQQQNAELQNFQYTPHHQELNVNAPVFVPHGGAPELPRPIRQQHEMTPEEWALQQQFTANAFMTPDQAAAFQNQQTFVPLLHGAPQTQFIAGQPGFTPQQSQFLPGQPGFTQQPPPFVPFDQQQPFQGQFVVPPQSGSYQMEQTTITPANQNFQQFSQ